MPEYIETKQLFETITAGSRNQFAATALDTNGEAISPATFNGAEYVIADHLGNVVFKAELGTGVTIDGNNFIVTIEDDDIDFSGDHTHQFRTVLSGERLEPIWRRRLIIKPRFTE